MNKQQLAAKIWESANQMRSKIEANEYKDYILGFIFYKFLSDKEVKFLRENDFQDEDIKMLDETDEETTAYVQRSIGYFIAYKDLFSTWLEKGGDFNVSDVQDGLSAFNRLIHPAHKKVFDGIFDTLQTGLSKLGDTTGSRTKAISRLLQLIKDIPMDGKQDYDVLGFIYEYLISMFAANAGKKAGEFYTPHEVSLLMSEIVAGHLKERNEIQIYDPTSGSGSLLINIGKSVSKYIDDERKIKYFAQELKQNTYNLTRMNLVMRGIQPDNIKTRNGDTLEDDWPYFDEKDPENTYEPLYVDAVVSNPPYSQAWDPAGKEADPRYARFGVAPKGKADYAFLLHDLYHLKSDGIMTIVLPHGVLFRGGEEGEIRKNLIEQNHIDAIIGLPANIFFGTGIPTIIMVLKQKRERSDVLIIDASKGYAKVGKNNQLRACDIKKISDTVARRENVEKYAQVVTQEEIRKNDYNLNIPRYVDSSENAETWDIYASMFGGMPKAEVAQFQEYWDAFPHLWKDLFKDDGSPYLLLTAGDIKTAVRQHDDIKAYMENFAAAFDDFSEFLKCELIKQPDQVSINREELRISEDIFRRLEQVPLIDKYDAFQALDDVWVHTAVDLEILQTEGFDAVKNVDPKMVLKKSKEGSQEVQDGWTGRVIPFDLVQETLLQAESAALKQKEMRLTEISTGCEELLDSLSEEEKESPAVNEAGDGFVAAEVANALKNAYEEAESEELTALQGYLNLLEAKAKRTEKEAYIAEHPEVCWANMEAAGDGTYAKGKVVAYQKELQKNFVFPEDSFAAKLVKVTDFMEEEKSLKAEIKKETAALQLLTKETIEHMTDEEARMLLARKWIDPILAALKKLPQERVDAFAGALQKIADKYSTTYSDLAKEIEETEKQLSSMIDQLTGSEFDMKGLSELQALLRGE